MPCLLLNSALLLQMRQRTLNNEELSQRNGSTTIARKSSCCTGVVADTLVLPEQCTRARQGRSTVSIQSTQLPFRSAISHAGPISYALCCQRVAYHLHLTQSHHRLLDHIQRIKDKLRDGRITTWWCPTRCTCCGTPVVASLLITSSLKSHGSRKSLYAFNQVQ
jgi:hypothetical protein